MTIEEAINTAIDYETRIRNLYDDAAETVSDAAGKRILQSLRDDEQHHIDYLTDNLKSWLATGKLSADKLTSTIPSIESISREAEKVQSQLSKKDRRGEIEILSKALKAEVETSRFYQQMVAELPNEGRLLFARFLEIEDNHIAAVQFELDYLINSGYWLDFKEFDMEEL